jgi:hypothetical protein
VCPRVPVVPDGGGVSPPHPFAREWLSAPHPWQVLRSRGCESDQRGEIVPHLLCTIDLEGFSGSWTDDCQMKIRSPATRSFSRKAALLSARTFWTSVREFSPFNLGSGDPLRTDREPDPGDGRTPSSRDAARSGCRGGRVEAHEGAAPWSQRRSAAWVMRLS